MHGIDLRNDHDAHVNKEKRGFDDCYQVMVHCESMEEAREVAKTLTDEFGPMEASR